MTVLMQTTTPHRDPPTSGYIRPVNLRTDLAPLADLIELVFASSMDEGGRAAIREMRTLSHLGAGLNMISRLSLMTRGIGMGNVWIEDGRLAGNVSIYPVESPMPAGHTWIIANVGVHPAYQRRGIAHRLMEVSLESIRERGGQEVILQVDYDNYGAIALYEKLGFHHQRAWTLWRRSSMAPAPSHELAQDNIFITRRRYNEWQKAYQLAERLRPQEKGGLGWLRPLHKQYFRKPVWKLFADWLMMSMIERLVIRDDEENIQVLLWVDRSHSMSSTRLTLIADETQHLSQIEAMLHYVLRRFRTSTLTIEHPHDEHHITDLLKKYRFHEQRTVWHMSYNLT